VATSPGFSTTAREQAHQILSRPPYTKAPSHGPPRPLAGVLHAMGRALAYVVGRPARWVYHHLLLHLGHGFKLAFGGWWPVAAFTAAVVAGVLVGVLLVRRRTRPGRAAGTAKATETEADPDALDRAAAEAEGSGDYETAVRLRFRAGLLRLARRGLLARYDALTDRQLSTQIGSPTFGSLAGRHEAIVFGRDPATALDAADARERWPRVPAEIGAGREPGGPR